ncbi:MAG: HAD-IA family hydrolase [bacterium]|nr:HAD-IA family hydrolase [bacterium]
MPRTANKKIKAVVFDFGGVIELYDGGGHLIENIAEYLGVPRSEFRTAFFRYNHLANVQNLTWEDMILKVVSLFTESKEKADGVKEMLRIRSLDRNLNAELLSFFPQLKKLGLKTGIFSNSNSILRERLKELGLLELADVLVISGDIGYQKPDKEAFQILFEKLKLKPEEVVFIDDTPRSLETADEIGYIPILFKDNVQLKTELEHIGIFVD